MELVFKDVDVAFRSCFTKMKKKLITHFDVKYKTKRDTRQIFHISKTAINKKSNNLHIFKTRLRKPIRVRKADRSKIKKIDADCIILCEYPNRYYICIPDKRARKDFDPLYSNVALDPGVATFQTFYSDSGVCGKLGDKMAGSKLMSYGKKCDLLTSLRSKTKDKRTRRNIRKRCFKLRAKMRNIVSDLHWKVAHFLCQNFENILIPDFEVENMIKRTPRRIRKIGSKTVRQMLMLSHGKFKDRLKYLASTYYGRKVIICQEDYTSKTCGNCGHLKKNLGGSRVYKCNYCGIKIDRDINGARNILLKCISDRLSVDALHGEDPLH